MIPQELIGQIINTKRLNDFPSPNIPTKCPFIINLKKKPEFFTPLGLRRLDQTLIYGIAISFNEPEINISYDVRKYLEAPLCWSVAHFIKCVDCPLIPIVPRQCIPVITLGLNDSRPLRMFIYPRIAQDYQQALLIKPQYIISDLG